MMYGHVIARAKPAAIQSSGSDSLLKLIAQAKKQELMSSILNGRSVHG